MRILGTRVDRIQNEDVLREMVRWIEDPEGPCRFIVNTGFHGIWLAYKDPSFHRIVEEADMFKKQIVNRVAVRIQDDLSHLALEILHLSAPKSDAATGLLDDTDEGV